MMKSQSNPRTPLWRRIALCCTVVVLTHSADTSVGRDQAGTARGVSFSPGAGPGVDGPPPFGPGGMGQETKLVKEFDKDGDGRLNSEERKAARESLKKQTGNRRSGGPGGRRGGFGPQGGTQATPQPGAKLTPSDVKSFPDVPLYDAGVLRTYFLEFENTDWEKELADFKGTDVEVPAKLTVDGRVYPDVGVHFHGMSSYMMVGEGQKRSLVLTLDFAHPDQQIGGYRKLNLLNSHEDASFLRTVLAMGIARDFMAAPKANFARVVINGECWGVYVNQQHFNKDLVKEWFGSGKGARWKVTGSPNGRGGLEYLGEDITAYKRIYTIKSKEDAKSWASLVRICKVLKDTPAEQLEQTLAPLLDIDGTLKFLAWDNVLANGDGFWTRASDYDLYLDEAGRFHVIPYDANETFSAGGGPGGPGGGGGPGGPGGQGGPGGPGGPGGRGGFGPGMFIAPELLEQADKNSDGTLSQEEFTALANAWYDRFDPDKTGKVSQEQWISKLPDVLPPPEGFGPPGGGPEAGGQPPGGGRGGFGPAMFVGPALFTALDANKDASLSRSELVDTFAKWFAAWDTGKKGSLDEEALRTGLNALLPRPNFGGPGGGPGGQPGRGGPGGGGVSLDPLVAANDSSKPLLSKLLAVPALRTRYLGYVRDIATTGLDWSKLGPLAQRYQALIAADIAADTRKLDSTEGFVNAIDGSSEGGGQAGGLKGFVEKRRAFLLNHAEVKKLGN